MFFLLIQAVPTVPMVSDVPSLAAVQTFNEVSGYEPLVHNVQNVSAVLDV
jgi:hypothetical protein